MSTSRPLPPSAAAPRAAARPPAAPSRSLPQRPEDTWVDVTMRRVLRIPPPGTRTVRDEVVYRTFSTSMVLSGLRCLLTYLILPVLLPLIGVAKGVGPAIGIPVALLALYFDVLGIRRFWLANHRLRKPVTVIYLAVMAMVTALLILDISHLIG